ncbi:MAG: class I SAM-dependent methyltransferase [Bacteroidia bacterium]
MNWLNPGDINDLRRMAQRRGWAFLRARLRLQARDRIQQTWEHMEHGAHWWTVPAVRRRWNEKATGDPELHYSQYVVDQYFEGKTGLRMLSPGCGTATPERRFAATGAFARIDAFDISENLVSQANATSQEEGLGDIVHAFAADVHNYELEANSYDIVLFHSSLHHFDNLEGIIARVKSALKPGGLLVINEYVGPDRLQFTAAQIQEINRLLAAMPESLRKRWPDGDVKKRAWPPGLWRMIASDPSEAVRSSEIPALLKNEFNMQEERWLGGDLLHLLLKDIGHHFQSEAAEVTHWQKVLFDAEDAFIKKRGAADFLFGVYKI